MEDVDFENTISDFCFSSVLYDGDTDPECERLAKGSQIRVLEERVAHAEQARDNAIAQADEAKAMSKAKGQRAGNEIGRLKRELEGRPQIREVAAAIQAIQPPDRLVVWLKGVVGRLPKALDDDQPFELRGSGVTLGVLRPWLVQFFVAPEPAAKPPTAASMVAVEDAKFLAGEAPSNRALEDYVAVVDELLDRDDARQESHDAGDGATDAARSPG